eukprot:CAMPEP_0197488108 /NCGR_PEP_ID=MMETSP1311-20131121/3101_1 /TAXON_ID=464262 /ORGANISM="Genus nov. species nov., Strain RCC856" /LENGTH=305 /DNA_ID=CAMNT_0043032033 /DNA_START=871 /DNA_END=1784 /DNA_ORIENTATION=+
MNAFAQVVWNHGLRRFVLKSEVSLWVDTPDANGPLDVLITLVGGAAEEVPDLVQVAQHLALVRRLLALAPAVAVDAHDLWNVLLRDDFAEHLEPFLTSGDQPKLLVVTGWEADLQHVPDGPKDPVRVHDVRHSKHFRVVLLVDALHLLEYVQCMQVAQDTDVQPSQVQDVRHLVHRVPHHGTCSGEEDPGLVFLGEDVDLHELLRGAVLEDLPPEAARLLKVNRVTLLVIPVVRRRHAPLQVSKLLLRENPSKNVVDVVLFAPLLHGGDFLPGLADVEVRGDEEAEEGPLEVAVHDGADWEAAVG